MRTTASALFGYALIILLLFWESLTGAVLVNRDLLVHMYPLRFLSASLWANGVLPLWNSSSASGTPLLADPSAGALDPLLPLFLLPVSPFQAGTYSLMLKYFFAAVAMRRYLLKIDVSQGAAFLGGCLFLLNGIVIGAWTHLHWVSAFMFLPLALAVPHSQRTSYGRGMSAAAIFTLSFFSGNVEATAFIVLFWIVECTAHWKPRRLGELAIGLFGCAALSLMLILPAFELHLMSDRRGGLNINQVLSYSVMPFQWIGYVAPVNFLGPDGGPSPGRMFPFAAPLFFGTYLGAALIPLLFLARRCRRFVALAILGLLFAMGRHFPGAESLVSSFPILGIFRYPQKFLILVAPSIAIIGALGYARFTSANSERALPCLLGTVAVVVIFIGSFDRIRWVIFQDDLTRAAQHSLVALVLSIFFIFRRSDKRILALLIILDLFIAARSALRFEAPSMNHAPEIRAHMAAPWPRVIAQASTDFPADRSTSKHRHDLMVTNSGILWEVRHPDDYSSFRLKNANWWLAAASQGTRGMGAIGIRYLLCDTAVAGNAEVGGWKYVNSSGGVHLFENPEVRNEVRYSEPADLTWQHFANGTLRVHLQSDSPGWLYRAESFYPGWTATVNGRKEEPEQARLALGQEIWISEPGNAEIEFEYRPRIFFIGLCASSLSAVLALIAIALPRKNPHAV